MNSTYKTFGRHCEITKGEKAINLSRHNRVIKVGKLSAPCAWF